VMRMQLDWCELDLVIQAAIACLPDESRASVELVSAVPAPVIWADHDRLEQVFVNLLGNALHHNPPGTTVRVDVRFLSRGSIELLVTDDGPGLPAELRESPFDSARRPRSNTSGAGLGLSISRGIIDAHGGTIELVATQAGTSFRIVLPVDAPEAAPEPAPDGVADSARTSAQSRPPAPTATPRSRTQINA
jgi:signal transduction histidine kinase